jgi:hypothetical protein
MLTSIGTSVDDAVPVERPLLEEILADAIERSARTA